MSRQECATTVIDDSFTEVERHEFYKLIGPLDVHPKIIGEFPYTSLFKNKNGAVKGIAVDSKVNGLLITRYYLPKGVK